MSKSFLDGLLKMRRSSCGKCRVVGSRSNNEYWVQDELDTRGEALNEARRLNNEARSFAPSSSSKITYYAHAPDGSYL